jgi:chorismate mutase/prephenate dehydratase
VFAEEGAPGTPGELDDLRAGIDAVDEQIVRLLDERARLARGVGEIKQKSGLDAYAPARERKVLNRVVASAAGDFPKRGHGGGVPRDHLFLDLAGGAVKVAYLGPESTFTHEAARRSFGASVELEPQTTVSEVFARVERGRGAARGRAGGKLDGGRGHAHAGRAHGEPR